MNCETTGVLPLPTTLLAAAASADSLQPLPLLAASNSSRCSSPMSPTSDHNGSAVSSNEDESMLGINLTINKSNNSNNSNNSSKHNSLSKRPLHLNYHHMTGPGLSSNNDFVDSYRQSHKMMKLSNDFSTSHHQSNRNKPNKIRHPAKDNNNNYANLNSPEFTQLFLEYRHVLLDVLAKAILLNNDDTESLHKGIVLPVKCQCGYTSELSKQITRSSTYVHQLELKFNSLLESLKVSPDPIRYTPKRPWFINSLPPYPIGAPKVSSLLEKKKSQMSATDKQQLLFSGNSSVNSSLNDDEADIDSDDDDVNEEMNLSGNLKNNSYINGSIDDGNVGGKTILEGYLESMKNNNNHNASEDGSDDDRCKEQHPVELTLTTNDVEGATTATGPGKRIDIKTKELVVQMQRNGASFTDISKQIGISRKSVRRIISNFQTYGSLENKREASRIQKGMQGRSFNQISGINSAIIQPKFNKQYIDDSNIFAKGQNDLEMGSVGTLNGMNGSGVSLSDSYLKEEMDDDKEMIVDENAADDEQDMDDDDDNEISIKNDISEMDPSLINSLNLFINKMHHQHQTSQATTSHQQSSSSSHKSKRNMSLIQGPYNGSGGYSQMKQSNHFQSQQQSNNNGLLNNNNNNRLSLIKPPDRYKPFDLKMRHNSSSKNESMSSAIQHHRIMKSHPIVPPLPTSSIYPGQSPSMSRSHISSKLYNNNNNGISPNGNNSINNDRDRESSLRIKNKLNRHSIDTLYKESLMVPEADKNNNTTLSNCNVTITSTSNSLSNNGKQTEIIPANLPPIPASLVDGSADSEANLVPKTFTDGVPPGIMNSLNPNRATKLTLEDFNIVWQLRSQHWTHNQIRRYFQQRGKSISKSSISRIMNGKQRNFQQFFNLVPSNSNY